MTASTLTATVIAQPALIAARDRGSTEDMFTWLASAALVITVICVLLYAINYLVNRWRYNSHLSLYYGLCRVHGLDRSQRALLRQVIRRHRLAHPARVFTEPAWLNSAKRGLQAAKVTALENRLFGEEKPKKKHTGQHAS